MGAPTTRDMDIIVTPSLNPDLRENNVLLLSAYLA